MKKLETVDSSRPSCWEMVICISLEGRRFSLKMATKVRRCRIPLNSTATSTSEELHFEERSRQVGPDSCSRYKVQGNRTERAELANDTEQCLDGWVYSTEFSSTTAVSEWDLVCDNAWKVPFSSSLFFFGVMIGSFVSGQLADRFGRKPVFFIALALQCVTAVIQACSVSWTMFCILNCLSGLGQISCYHTSLILGSEMLSPSVREIFILLGHCTGFSLGIVVLPLFAYLMRDWRMLLGTMAIPCILLLPAWWLIPESPRWLLQKGRMQEAEQIIRECAKKNGVSAPEVLFRADDLSELMENAGEKTKTYTYLDLIRTHNMRNITFIGFYIWLSVSMVFYGLSINTSNLKGNIYLSCFFSGVVDTFVCIAAWVAIKRIQRQIILFSTLMFTGIMLLVIQLVPEDMPVMFQVLVLIGKMGVSCSYSVNNLFFTELIPTVVRNMGVGVNSTGARIGSIICPYLLYIGTQNKILPYVVFGTVSITAAAVSMLLPDTRNSKLPDLISEAKAIRGCFCASKQKKRNTSEGSNAMC
uniref:Major facilitator superfamily (MFS) profile domain-containing protein n=2 Tax=Cynoglossus semilaevis TaxID=244447 RepID=A0A3P8W4B6_CYNSE